MSLLGLFQKNGDIYAPKASQINNGINTIVSEKNTSVTNDLVSDYLSDTNYNLRPKPGQITYQQQLQNIVNQGGEL
jgi:hypothetical protein